MERIRTTISTLATILVIGVASILPHGAHAPELSGEDDAALESAEGHPPSRTEEYLLLAAHLEGRADALEALRQGLDQAALGNAAAARDLFGAAAARFPGVGDWAAVLAADATAAEGDTAAVRALLAEAEPELVREWGWRAVVRARRVAGDRTGAIAAAVQAAGDLPTAGLRAEAWSRAAALRLAAADSAGARETLVTAVEADPLSEHALSAGRTLSEMPNPSAREQRAVARLYLRHGNLGRGLAAADAYLQTGQGTAEERAEVALATGMALFRAGRTAEVARRMYALAEDRATPSTAAADALLLAGRARFREGQRSSAIETFERLADRFPQGATTAHALFILADLAHDDGRLDAARTHYRRALSAAPGSEYGAESAMRLGSMALIGGDPQRAAQVFETLRVALADPPTRQRAAYWSGRAHQEAGRDSVARDRFDEALRLDPASWYGLRSADHLSEGSWGAALSPSPPTDETTDLAVRGALHRLDLLEDLGTSHLVAFETERVRRHFARSGSGLYALAEALHERGRTFPGVSVGREIQRSGHPWSERLLRIIYPFPYRETILAEAEARGVDPFLLAGLIRQESMFDPSARSPAGAVGLMQVMPRTARALASRVGAGAITDAMLQQPDLNVRLGVLYVSDLMGRYDRAVDMLAAYNAGAGRLAGWRRLPEHRDAELFAERIPYQETREYVKVVQQNARLYRALYGPDRDEEAGPLLRLAVCQPRVEEVPPIPSVLWIPDSPDERGARMYIGIHPDDSGLPEWPAAERGSINAT